MQENVVKQDSVVPIDSVESLQNRIKELEEKLEKFKDLDEELAEEREEHQRTSQTMSDIQATLQGTIKSNRRQLEQIAKAHEKFLPHSYPKAGGVEFAAHCRPCADVGGDFYDVFEMFDGRLAICIADVAGHGATASICMATARSLLRAALLEAEPYHSPSDIFEKLSFWLSNQFEIGQFVTMWFGIYDPETKKLSASSAAHPKAVIWRHDSDPEYLDIEPGLPLGLAGIESSGFEEVTIDLGVGDRIFLYTDSWLETPTKNGDMMDKQAFLNLCSDTYGHSVKQVWQIMFMHFERHAANSKIMDDISLLAFDRVE